MERKMKVYPARDDRNRGGGISSAKLVMFVKGKGGVVAFTVYCGWYIGLESKRADSYGVQIHSYKRIGENDYENVLCDFLEGKKCYSSEYSLLGIDLMNVLIERGDEPVWKKLEEMYTLHLERE